MKFDPLFERRQLRRQSDVTLAVKARVQDLSDCVNALISTSELPELNGADQLLKDVILVVGLGGLQGVNAISTVPEHFSERIGYIRQIVNTASKKDFSLAEMQFFVSICAASSDSEYVWPCSEKYMPMLQQVSEATSTVHTAFISPPVSSCILPACEGSALSRPHPPVVVTVSTLLSGPLPALKCCLRYNKCGTIYNYNMYGKKKQGGEEYYDVERKYVEISDVAYCERQLYTIYCFLR